MTRAEERALEAYPVKMVNGPIGYEKSVFDFNALCRHIFQEGYEQAENDIHKEMLEFMEKQKEALLADHDYDIHIEPAAGFDTGSVVVYHNDRSIEQLTWKDIKDIVRTADGLMHMAESLSDTEKRVGVQTYYEEVLRRFKEAKK